MMNIKRRLSIKRARSFPELHGRARYSYTYWRTRAMLADSRAKGIGERSAKRIKQLEDKVESLEREVFGFRSSVIRIRSESMPFQAEDFRKMIEEIIENDQAQ